MHQLPEKVDLKIHLSKKKNQIDCCQRNYSLGEIADSLTGCRVPPATMTAFAFEIIS